MNALMREILSEACSPEHGGPMESGQDGISEALKSVVRSLELTLLLISTGLAAFEHLARFMLLGKAHYSHAWKQNRIAPAGWLSGLYQS